MPALWILSFLNGINLQKRLSVVFILFVWRYINGPVKLLSLETWPIVDFFSVTGINNGCNQFKFKLWNYPCYYSKHQHQRAGLWFISVLQKWDAVHNNIQGRRKIGKLSLIYSKPRLYSRAKQRIVLCSNGFYCSLESVCCGSWCLDFIILFVRFAAPSSECQRPEMRTDFLFPLKFWM